MPNMWMVRAGEGASKINEFKSKNIVAVGWNKLDNIFSLKNINSNRLKEIVKEKYPEYSTGQLAMSASQISKFAFEFEKGDYVVSYNPNERVYLVGEILSDYEYNNKLDFHHTRKVKWLGEVFRDKLSATTKNTLGAISTIFEVIGEQKEEILKLLKGKVEVLDKEESKEELDILKEDMLSKAHEFIKDQVLSLDPEEMQELVAGILRGMSYKTIVSPKGSDRGKDIEASPDGLGLEEPRIKVEVKHRSGQMGSKEIRSFTGGLRPGDKGLYVSTGGFSKDALYEAERSNVPIKLIDSDLLVKLIVQHYDNFDVDTKTLIPLVKIYWPA